VPPYVRTVRTAWGRWWYRSCTPLGGPRPCVLGMDSHASSWKCGQGSGGDSIGGCAVLLGQPVLDLTLTGSSHMARDRSPILAAYPLGMYCHLAAASTRADRSLASAINCPSPAVAGALQVGSLQSLSGAERALCTRVGRSANESCDRSPVADNTRCHRRESPCRSAPLS
jgi:hypothetical protein